MYSPKTTVFLKKMTAFLKNAVVFGLKHGGVFLKRLDVV
jgi:hypothetical protein